MSISTIPGLCAKHKVVTPECQQTHGGKAVAIALNELRKEFEACNTSSNLAAGARFHFVLTVERPEA